MGNFFESAAETIKGSVCDILKLQNNYYHYVGALSGVLPPLTAAKYAEALTGWAYRSLCDSEPPSPLSPGYTGGQCPVTYNIRIQWTAHVVGETNPRTGTNYPAPRLGPITAIEAAFVGTAWGVNITANGTTDFYALLTAVTPSSIYDQAITEKFVERQDGMPDTCGNPPPPPPVVPPGWNDRGGDITYIDVDSTEINVPFTLVLGNPTVNLLNKLVIPLRIQLGDIDVNIGGSIDIQTGDINIDFGNKNYAPGDGPKPDGYRSPDDTPDYPPGVPEPGIPPSPSDDDSDTTRILRACIVTVTTVPSTITQIFQSDNPDIYAPNFGYVNFYVAVGQTTAWTSDIPVKNRRNYIEVPAKGGALKVAGTPRPGVVWTITPVYALEDDVVTFE